jgi:hypothetical protein
MPEQAMNLNRIYFNKLPHSHMNVRSARSARRCPQGPADARNPVRIRISAFLSNNENHDLRFRQVVVAVS